MSKNKNFNQNNNKKGEYNRNAKYNNNSSKEREKELLQNRSDDFQLIDMICAALNDKIEKIYQIRTDALENQKKISREETRIGMSDIFEYFKNHEKEFPSKNRIAALINVLIDLAKCQVNTKLMDYHVAIRMIYFGEKFQSYFSTEYDEKRQEMIAKYPSLFNTWNLSHVVFVRSDATDEDIENAKYLGATMLIDDIMFIG